MRRILLLLIFGVSALSAQGVDKVNVVVDVVYGHDFGMATTFDVYLPTEPTGAGVILINSAGWESPFDQFKVKSGDTYRFSTNEEMSESGSWHVLSPRLLVTKGFTVFEVRHGSEPKFEMQEIVQHVRR
jgi:hypothetical protein